ncbi:MAG: hypothetical protein AABX83_02910 [Nanoarchaeota archaeon]
MSSEKPRFISDLLNGGVKDKCYLERNHRNNVIYRVAGVDYGINTDTGTIELLVNAVEICKNGSGKELSREYTRRLIDCLYDRRVEGELIN